MKRIRAVFFDADDTVFTVHPSIAHHYSLIFERHGVRADRSLLAQTLKACWMEFVSVYENRAGGYASSIDGDRSTWNEFARRVVLAATGTEPHESLVTDIYRAFAAGSSRRIYHGVADAIKSLSARGIFVGLFTNNDMRTHDVLKELFLHDLFDVVLTAGEVGYKKPAPEAFARLLERSGTIASETLFVGDSLEHDYRGARGAGWHAVLMHGTRNAAAAGDAEELIIASDFQSLLKLIP